MFRENKREIIEFTYCLVADEKQRQIKRRKREKFHHIIVDNKLIHPITIASKVKL